MTPISGPLRTKAFSLALLCLAWSLAGCGSVFGYGPAEVVSADPEEQSFQVVAVHGGLPRRARGAVWFGYCSLIPTGQPDTFEGRFVAVAGGSRRSRSYRFVPFGQEVKIGLLMTQCGCGLAIGRIRLWPSRGEGRLCGPE
jgi:hypothetical protein